MGEGTWIAAHEGYYGPPLRHEQRLDLVRWSGANGFDGYGYSPKDDERNRARWREPYPADAMAQFAELHAACVAAGIELVVMLSPGLDWRAGDPAEVDAVVAKLAAFAEIGVSSFAINWDDVPGSGASDGAEHGGAVASAVRRAWRPDRAAADVDELPGRLRRGVADRVPARVRHGVAGRRRGGVDRSERAHPDPRCRRAATSSRRRWTAGSRSARTSR